MENEEKCRERLGNPLDDCIAEEKDIEKVWLLIRKYPNIFPHITFEYIRKKINKKEIFLENGTIVIYRKLEQNENFGDTVIPAGTYHMQQIANENPGSGYRNLLSTKFYKYVVKDSDCFCITHTNKYNPYIEDRVKRFGYKKVGKYGKRGLIWIRKGKTL